MHPSETFDFVIVGAGTAGCVLANRLSANPKARVLLIEAGGQDDYIWVRIPVGNCGACRFHASGFPGRCTNPAMSEAQYEDHLKASGLVYTIIRPGGLTDEPATGNGMLTEDVTVGGEMTRADLGRLVAASIDDPKAANKVYSAVDRNRIAKTPMAPSR